MKKKLTLLLLLFNLLLATAQSHDNTNLHRKDPLLVKAYEWYPKYVTFLPTSKIDSVLAYAQTDIVPVVFDVNNSTIRENNQLKEITSLINSIQKDSRIKVAYLWIGGSASPEGTIEGNKKLGASRSEALLDYLKSNANLENIDVVIENLWEDWKLLTRAIINKEFPNKNKVIEIISKEQLWEKRKMDIKAIDNGKTWEYLLQEVFPTLRNARLVIVCTAEDVKDAPPSTLKAPEETTRPTPIPEAVTMNQDPEENRFWSIKTNALHLGILVANLGLEFELHPKWTLDIPIWYSPYDYTPTRKIRILATQPELRYWLKEAGRGSFVGAHAHIAGFNVAINDNGRYQDPNRALWGAGLSYGYAVHLDRNKHWALEFNLGAGFAKYHYDVYRNWNNGPMFKSGEDLYWGITRAGISIAYKFYNTRNK